MSHPAYHRHNRCVVEAPQRVSSRYRYESVTQVEVVSSYQTAEGPGFRWDVPLNLIRKFLPQGFLCSDDKRMEGLSLRVFV